MKPYDAKHLLLYLVYGKPPGLCRFRSRLNWLAPKECLPFLVVGKWEAIERPERYSGYVGATWMGMAALGLIDGNEALAIFRLGQFLLGYVDTQDAVFELGGNVVF